MLLPDAAPRPQPQLTAPAACGDAGGFWSASACWVWCVAAHAAYRAQLTVSEACECMWLLGFIGALMTQDACCKCCRWLLVVSLSPGPGA